jgi:hypothetical protein
VYEPWYTTVADRRIEEQRQVRAGQQQDHEGPQRDLAQHERPVVGEYLAHQDPDALGAVEPVVKPPADAGKAGRDLYCVVAHPRSQKLGPTGCRKSRGAAGSPHKGVRIPGLATTLSAVQFRVAHDDVRLTRSGLLAGLRTNGGGASVTKAVSMTSLLLQEVVVI